jgi:hypothetical protein
MCVRTYVCMYVCCSTYMRKKYIILIRKSLDTKYPEINLPLLITYHEIRERTKETTTFLLRAFYIIVRKLPVT